MTPDAIQSTDLRPVIRRLLVLAVLGCGVLGPPRAVEAQGWLENPPSIYCIVCNVGVGTASPQTLFHIYNSDSTDTLTTDLRVEHAGGGGFGQGTGIGLFGGGVELGRLAVVNDVSGGSSLRFFTYNVGLTERLRITSDGNLGIGTTGPSARLSVVGAGASQIGGSAASTTLRASAGNLGYVAGDTLALASFGFLSSNSSSLGVRAYRTANGVDWYTTAIGLAMDVDSTPTAGAALWLNANGNVGIGTTNPLSRVHIVDGTSGIAIPGALVTHSGNGVKVTHANTDYGLSMGTTSGGGAPFIGLLAEHSTTVNAFRNMGAANRGFVIWNDGAGIPGIRFDWNGVSTPFADFTSVTTALMLRSDGKVGIGTTSPATALHVVGDLTLTGTGNISATGNIAAKYQDLAEWVPARRSIAVGSVVILDQERSNTVMPSLVAYDTRVAGVISARPGLILGEGGEGKVMVATTGRVKVKVDASRGPIRIGDLLVTSDREGVAMRSKPVQVSGIEMHRPGTLIGKALEPLPNGEGEILVLLSLQ